VLELQGELGRGLLRHALLQLFALFVRLSLQRLRELLAVDDLQVPRRTIHEHLHTSISKQTMSQVED
jgi:hypothetical protein